MTPDKDGGTIRHGGASDYLAKHWQSQTFNKCVGLAIRTTRTLKGITITQLAKSVGLTQSTMSRMETGHMQVNVVHLRKISRALNVSASLILKRAEEYSDAEEHPEGCSESE